jgi:AraC family transcriptional regulator
VADVLCTCGPRDRPYEERHAHATIAIVLAGSFQYRAPAGRAVMTAASLLLGSHGHSFECAHPHGEGDRCLSFWYAPDYFEQLAADAGARGSDRTFRVPRLPPLRPLSPLIARAAVGLGRASAWPWEEIAVSLAARTISLAAGVSSSPRSLPLNAETRVTNAIRLIERQPAAALSLGRLAREAGFSPYHFLRTFTTVTGMTPHRYVRRARLLAAASRLTSEPSKVIDIALDCGFTDISTFNRAFRTEFGASPRAFRRQCSTRDRS